MTIQDIVNGALSLSKESIENKRTIQGQIEYKNGETHAIFEYAIYRSNKALFWNLRRIRAEEFDKNRTPCSQLYIEGFNAKAKESNMPMYDVFHELEGQDSHLDISTDA